MEILMTTALLFRRSLASKYELRHAEKHFRIDDSRVTCRNCLVIGRYSVEPFYDELERDLRILGSRLVNSPEEHKWIAAFEYYAELRGFTPETWDEQNIHLCSYSGPFVVKGKLSSKKHNWSTHMFAPTKAAAIRLARRLKDDDREIREQGVVYRRYVPLRTFEVGVNGLRYTNEWRFFYFKDKLLSVGYYWSQADCLGQAELKPEGHALANKLAQIVASFATFYTLDLAETEDGDWILIEINDAQTAVPSENDLDELYGRLRQQTA
jgi:hypothetical protein